MCVSMASAIALDTSESKGEGKNRVDVDTLPRPSDDIVDAAWDNGTRLCLYSRVFATEV